MPHPDRLVFDMKFRTKYDDGFYYDNSIFPNLPVFKYNRNTGWLPCQINFGEF